jgi:hypothetical protein
MVAEHTLAHRPDALDGLLRALVTQIGLDLHPDTALMGVKIEPFIFTLILQ